MFYPSTLHDAVLYILSYMMQYILSNQIVRHASNDSKITQKLLGNLRDENSKANSYT